MKNYIRYPLNIKIVVSMLVLASLCILNSILVSDRANKWLYLGFSIIYLLIMIVVIVRRFLKPRLLMLENKVLIINHIHLEANDISRIYIDTTFTIGIKPKRNKIVPLRLCFKFCHTNKELNGLIEWAQNNNIKVSQGTFFRWI